MQLQRGTQLPHLYMHSNHTWLFCPWGQASLSTLIKKNHAHGIKLEMGLQDVKVAIAVYCWCVCTAPLHWDSEFEWVSDFCFSLCTVPASHISCVRVRFSVWITSPRVNAEVRMWDSGVGKYVQANRWAWRSRVIISKRFRVWDIWSTPEWSLPRQLRQVDNAMQVNIWTCQMHTLAGVSGFALSRAHQTCCYKWVHCTTWPEVGSRRGFGQWLQLMCCTNLLLRVRVFL